MNEFKIGQKVKVNNFLNHERRGQIGSVVEIRESDFGTDYCLLFEDGYRAVFEEDTLEEI